MHNIAMSRVSNFCLTLCLALASTFSVWAAEPKKCALQGIAELPVTMEGMSPTIPVKINGIATKMVADSGAFYSIISQAAATRHGMTQGLTPFGLTAKGVNGSVSLQVYVAKDFDLAGIPLHKVEFLVGGREFSTELAGFLGQNILALADVEYDFANGVIRLFKPKDCGKAMLAYWAGPKGASILPIEPLSFEHRSNTSKAWVNGKAINVLFDTGASTSVLKRSVAEKVGIQLHAEDVQPGGLGFGFGKRMIESWVSPVANFTIGDEQITNTRLRIGDVDLQDSDMLLGADFFLSHRVFVSNSQHKLYFTYNGGPVFKLDRSEPQTAQTQAQIKTPPTPATSVNSAPLDAAGLSRRGAASASRRDFASAAADFTQAIALEPAVAQHYYDRANVRLALGQKLLGKEDLDHGLQLDPNKAAGLIARGALYLSENDLARAQVDFKGALQAAPQDQNVGLSIAKLYEFSQHYEAAVAEYDAWFAAFPKSDRLPQSYNERCWTRALWGRDLNIALEDCNAAIKLGKRNSAYLDSRGLVYLRLGRLDEAIADYDEAIKLQPKQAWSLYGRGLAKQRKGLDGAADIQAGLAIQPSLAERAKQIGLVAGKVVAAP